MSFLTSLAIILLSALLLGGLLCKIKLPPLIGFLLVGIVLSPRVLNLISADILNISSDLRQFALIIILTRAGLSLKPDDLKKVGRPAILLCFLPATFEIIGYVIFAPLVSGLSIQESALSREGSEPLSANFKERLFCAIAYIPKATVQAAIGAIPLAAGLKCGQTILTCAVLAILVTAPLGAIATDFSYKKLLGREKADRFCDVID